MSTEIPEQLPKLDLDAMKSGEVVDLAPEPISGESHGDDDLEHNKKMVS